MCSVQCTGLVRCTLLRSELQLRLTCAFALLLCSVVKTLSEKQGTKILYSLWHKVTKALIVAPSLLTRGGTMYRFCPRIVVSWHLRRPRTCFQTRFQTRSQTRFRTRFRFQHFPEPRQNLVSVFLVIFFFSCFFLFFSVVSPVFPVFFPVFLVFRWKMIYLVSYRFPFIAENLPRIPYRFPFLAKNLPRIPYRFPFLAKNSPRIALFS